MGLASKLLIGRGRKMSLSEMKVFSEEVTRNSIVNHALRMMGFYSEESQDKVKQKKTLEHEVVMIIANNWIEMNDGIRSELTHFNRVTSGKVVFR